ncbi:MAG: peptidoglycan editing factor PgeF [Rickettsiales bacterium]|nr:peptidoglycan editing factor PgeF [Rickettsiales bacterium]
MIANDYYVTDSSIELPNVKYGFFTRKGRVSGGLYQSLNVGLQSGDERKSVMENRRRVAGTFGVSVERLYTLSQAHSNAVQLVTPSQLPEIQPEADALVTKHPNCVIGILTADCVPVLFMEPKSGIVGAAHAGWRGAFDGIIANTITFMERLGADRKEIIAIVGPAIHQPSYEVDAGFKDRFVEQNADNEALFIPSKNADHFMFDLPGYVIKTLEGEEIKQVTNVDRDTYTDEENFFSYRRKTHKNEDVFGRQISAIMIKDTSG